jgi:hypothetical protein
MKLFYTALLVTICISASSQNLLLNGSFENNSAIGNVTNLTTSWPLYVSDSWEVDAGRMNLDSISNCGVASDGNYYVTNCAGCGGVVSTYIGFSLKLSTPMIQNAWYVVSLDKKYCGDASPIDIGISSDSTFVGTNIHTFAAPSSGNWEHDSYIFQAPAAGLYLTVGAQQINALDTGSIALDNFQVIAGTCGTNVQVINDSCFGSCNGAIVFTPVSGTPPYSLIVNGTFITSFNSSYTYSNLCPGSYFYRVEDALSSCGDSTFITVNEPTILSVTGTTVSSTCAANSDGSITLSASGGISPYMYSIDFGITWQVSPLFINLPAGTYTVSVRDTNGCVATTGLSITSLPPMVISFTPGQILCYGDTVLLCANIFFGNPPYTFLWSTGSTVPCIIAVAGDYHIQIQDVNGCTAIDSITITEPPPLTTTVHAILPSCGQCDGIASPSVSGGTFPYTYLWQPIGSAAPLLSNFCTGLYTLFVVDVNGCLDSTHLDYSIAQCDSVWPGDADNNGVADNNDVLALGINYGVTGPIRTGASNSWVGQTCLNWPDTLADGVNIKHSDCDGNGIINADDTLPISLNYGLVHARLLPPVYNAGIPDLSLQCTTDTIGPHQLLHVKMHLGSTALPVPAIYGLAFSIQLDPALIDTNTISFDYSTSALGNIGTNLLSFHYSFNSTGTIDVAVTKTDQLNAINIDSIIGVLNVVITDNVSTISTLRPGISDVTAITLDESYVALNSRGDSVVIDPAMNGIHSVLSDELISIYPSPAHDYLKIISEIQIRSVSIINSFGEIKMNQDVNQKNVTLNLNSISNGFYVVELKTTSGLIRKRICVVK